MEHSLSEVGGRFQFGAKKLEIFLQNFFEFSSFVVRMVTAWPVLLAENQNIVKSFLHG